MSQATDWGLRNAEVGSPVRVRRGSYEPPSICRVSKANKTRVTLTDGSEWTRRGQPYGRSGRWHSESADLILDMPAVEREIDEIRAARDLEQARRTVRHRCTTEWRDLSADQCSAIIAILDAAKASESPSDEREQHT